MLKRTGRIILFNNESGFQVRKKITVPLVVVCTIFLFACSNTGKDEKVEVPDANTRVKINQAMVKNEDRAIDSFVRRHKNWNIEKTGTGLRYEIYEQGNGERAVPGMYATINYEVKLLDGTLVYSSEKNGPEEFLIEMDDVESGLHEGIQFMRVGDRARMIIPSHLAHGLTGDQRKIPPFATLIFDVKLVSLK